MSNSIKKPYIIFFFICSMFYFLLNMPLATNGKAVFYINDLLCIGLWLYYFYFLFVVKKQFSKTVNLLTISVISLAVYYLGVTIGRYLSGNNFTNSFFLSRTTFLSVIVCILILSDIFFYKDVINIIPYFCVIILIAYCVRSIQIQNIRNDLFVALMPFLSVLFTFIPFCFYRLAYLHQHKIDWVSCTSIAFAGVISILSGSRAGLYVGGGSFIIGCIVVLIKNKIQWRSIALAVIGSTLIIVVFYSSSLFSVRDYISRSFNTSFISSEEGYATGDKIDSNENDMGVAESDSLRSMAWKVGLQQLRKNPIFGSGEVSVMLPKDYSGRIALHNIILEHLAAYGIIGVVIWLLWFIIPIYPIVLKINIKAIRDNWAEIVLAVLSIGANLAIAMVQSSTPLIPTIAMWTSVGVWSQLIFLQVNASAEKNNMIAL